jgi:hypothetical protein
LSNGEEKLRVLEGGEVPFTLIGCSIFNAYVSICQNTNSNKQSEIPVGWKLYEHAFLRRCFSKFLVAETIGPRDVGGLHVLHF